MENKQKKLKKADNPSIGLNEMLSTSIIPMQISETGAEDEPLSEIIICDSISGVAMYENGMPKELTLIRKLADGKEYRMKYKQADNI